MKKPHICFVSESRATYGLLTSGESNTTVGGAEVQQTLLAPALQKLGYKVTFLVPDLGQPDKVVTGQGITLIKTREQFKGGGIRRNLQDMRLLFKALGRAGADIYYQRTSMTITGIVSFYCSQQKKKFVFSVASNMDLDGTTRKQMKPHYHRLYWYGLTHADAVIVQTDDQMHLLKQNVGKDGVVIRSTFPSPDLAGAPSDKEYVLWVGNYREVRRPGLMIDLVAGLPQYKFVMVGGPFAGEESLFTESLARGENLPNLKITGAVPYKEVGRYFSKAKLFVNTSSIEGFPNTYLQAWSRRLPVIATFDADNLIARYGLGRFCKDEGELKGSVSAFMENDDLRESVGTKALQYVQENHSLEAVAAQYDSLFMQLHKG